MAGNGPDEIRIRRTLYGVACTVIASLNLAGLVFGRNDDNARWVMLPFVLAVLATGIGNLARPVVIDSAGVRSPWRRYPWSRLELWADAPRVYVRVRGRRLPLINTGMANLRLDGPELPRLRAWAAAAPD